MSDLKAEVTAYRGFLVLELLATNSDNTVTTALDRPGSLGHVVHDTARNLGMSKEARELLRTIRVSGDSLAEVNWFTGVDGNDHFGWLGRSRVVLKVSSAEASKGFKMLSAVEIPNEVPDGARRYIDTLLS
ncbi:MAG TPA: hypothetical protein VFM18_21135 [Methanosarcina sp.]|nr:hypothetical protein [Methanosarcina sp.]